ncbi:CDN_1a_G0022320.mRNA.1.CDS.1 [Saccharomyces cerevisiae]|nr:CCC_1a_G0022420.mRNA.1.CDS.1 [Saccharomyces cerevisiae]CAI4512771.1 CDN_1a_G0022320.mRNA.1.CDS.1 [Saccharomyces cerevisiae]CAI7318839.1 CCC_1a_G0022420.mRNA.1.CDS.1 [Saccharomyces cerevisiae]CAI7319344.1 CDN_1a_G0022320.mRNA.1.CDS.1 [Saccharomyces cerevisiae]
MSDRNTSNSLTLKERMLSAGAGSVLTSLILTPMDVVRIRLQQQQMIPDCSCDGAAEVPNAVSSGSKMKTFTNVGGQNLNNAKIFWESACFQELHCKNSSLKFNGTLEAFTKIASVEGVTSLWRGISLTLLMAIPANMVYFSGYEYIRDVSPIASTYPTLNPLFCGAIARVFAATSIAPLELVKTKLQSIPRSSKSTKTWMMVKDLLNETRQEMKMVGPSRALFKGLEITLWRDVPFSAIYWSSYELCKERLWLDSTRFASKDANWVHFINSFASGCISGMIAAICTHPFDVGKTRWQISMMNNSDPKGGNRSRNMFKFLETIWRTEGLAALYTGLAARVIKIAPSCAIMISSYEISKKVFGNKLHQ